MFPSLLRKLTTCTRTQQSSGRNEQAFLLYRGCSSLDVLPQSSASLQPTRSSMIKKRSPLFLFCLIKYSFSCKTSFTIFKLITPSCLKLSAILNFSFVLSAILLAINILKFIMYHFFSPFVLQSPPTTATRIAFLFGVSYHWPCLSFPFCSYFLFT